MALRNVFPMNTEELKQKLVTDGFIHVYEWLDIPNQEYPIHKHQGRVGMHILKGEVTFSLRNETVILSQGDYFEVPVGVEHTAQVGDQGCHFLVGEMIEGDS